METIYKTYRVEVKDVDAENGIIDMLIPLSTGSVDRDGEVVEPTAWKKSLPAFRKRPVLLSSHDYRDLRKQIGEFVTIKVIEEGLLGKPKYYINEGNEEADWAFKLAAKNMAAYSVGFIPKVWEDGDSEKGPRRTYKEAELLEISHIVVPSNRDAIQGVRAKSLEDPVFCELCDEVLDAEDLITKPEVTENYIRIPVPGESGKHEGHRIRTITISEEKGIKALYCGECKKNTTYLFDKDKWSMSEAQAWVNEHKEVEGITLKHSQKEVSQAEIVDELDYIIKLIETEGMNEEVKKDAWDLVREIMRLTGEGFEKDPLGFRGNHIPLDILEKVGAVLSSKNRGRLKEAQNLIQSVIDSAGETEPEKTITPTTEIALMVAKAVRDEIDRLQGKVF